jgi:Domain of unknown function (DUF5680)
VTATDLPAFAEFLQAAKAATYAAQGDDASVAPALPDSKQFEFRDGALLYRDVYVGMFRFIGQEIVYSNDRALWSMSYAGGLMQGVAPSAGRSIYNFLRHALLAPSLELPVRGPAEFNSETMRYVCTWQGSLQWFHGSESILQDGHAVYELRFCGGMLA